MKGYFCVCENPNEKFDISFQVRENVEDDIPEEQQELYLNAEKTCNIIKSLENTDESTKKKYFDKLLSLSRVGLVPEYAQTNASKIALEKLQEEIVLVEGKRIKNEYMKVLAIEALVLFAIASGLAFLVDSYVHISIVWNIWAVIIGALVGTWVSFGARKFEIGFDDLASLEKDKMNPWIRLIYISVAAVIFVLFMDAGLVEIKVGNIDTAAALENMQSAFIIGLVCGLIESKIGVNVYKRAVGTIDEKIKNEQERTKIKEAVMKEAKSFDSSNDMQKTDLHDGYYVLSFCLEKDSMLMWSQYSDFIGYCMEFDYDKLIDSLKQYIIKWEGKVIYNPKEQKECLEKQYKNLFLTI